MARTRTIKPHFLQSMSMDKVSVGAQLTFVRLWLLADDAGRLQDDDRPPGKRSRAFREPLLSRSGSRHERRVAEGTVGGWREFPNRHVFI